MLNAEHRDLAAAGVGDQQITPVTGGLEGALRADALTGAGSAGDEWRAGNRCERAVWMSIETGDGIDPSGVVVDVQVANDVRAERFGLGDTERAAKNQRERADRSGYACGYMHVFKSSSQCISARGI